jgi:hypothetical protein
MDDTRNFKERSFQNNLDEFLEKITDLEFYQLVNFLNSTFMDTDANELQTEFIDEFFGLDEWPEYVRSCRASSITFYSNQYIHVAETLKKVKEFLLFRMSHRFIDTLLAKSEAEQEVTKLKIKVLDEESITQHTKLNLLELKLELSKAVENSYDDGVFWKDEGWCNISEVLIKNKLLKLEK